jgi:hypothetical protein
VDRIRGEQNCIACLFCNKRKVGWFHSKEKLFCEKTNKPTLWNLTCEKFWRVSEEIVAARYNSWDLTSSEN